MGSSNNHIYQTSTHQPSLKRRSFRGSHPCTPISSNSVRSPRDRYGKAESTIKTTSVLSGSMTVEAALALPIFVFFLLNLLWIIEVYTFHGMLTASLRETGNKLSVYGYIYDRMVDEEDDKGLEAFAEDIAFSYLYVKNCVEKNLGKEYISRSPVVGGTGGLYYLDCSVMQHDDIIDLTVSYKVSPFVRTIGWFPIWNYSRYYSRAWTGYDVSRESKEDETIWVYVTEYGTVYHPDRTCSYLMPDILETSYDEIERLRSSDGSIYRPCEFCAPVPVELADGIGTPLYVTRDGTRYHNTVSCSRLRRSIYKMDLKEAKKKYRACSKCG